MESWEYCVTVRVSGDCELQKPVKSGIDQGAADIPLAPWQQHSCMRAEITGSPSVEKNNMSAVYMK